MWKIGFFLPLSLLAQTDSMLSQADWITKKYSVEVAKAPPPPLSPQPQECLDTASIWFTLDLAEMEDPAFQTLNQDLLWDCLIQIGVEGVYLKGLKKGGEFRTAISLDPKWGSGWDELALKIEKRGTALIGDSLGTSTGLSADFWLALKNVGDYPGLYHLVEVEQKDWKLLPQIAGPQFAVNIPWLSLQELHKKGYVPQQFAPYVKKSSWNATAPIQGNDGKTRRWIYLMRNEVDPVIDWLNPSFAGSRIAAADTLDSVFNLGQKILFLNGAISQSANETLCLWTRKLGSYSVLEPQGGLDELKKSSSDLMCDILTRPALLHAMIAQDAEALKLIYRLFLQEGIESKRLVHTLQPFDAFTCDWSEFLIHPKKKYPYYEEVLTGEALRMRLLKEDVARIGEKEEATWPALCSQALGIKDFEGGREEITNAHLLLAFFYAMQPGVFSFSASDLLGTVERQTIDLMKPNQNTLYPSLPGQLKNPKSFAMQLKKTLSLRRDNQIQTGTLTSVPETKNRGVILLLHRLSKSGMLHLLAVNFGPSSAQEILEIPSIRGTTAIDLMSGFAEKKAIDSTSIRIDLLPMSGKSILFQTKYYD